MNTYYCYACMMKLGLYAPPADPATLNLTGSPYQFKKFMEHTVQASGAHKQLNSIYSDPTYDQYKNYYVSGSAAGCLEVQADGKKNLIWYASSSLGPAYDHGCPLFTGDIVKIVFPENTGKLHHFHVDSQQYQAAICLNCGQPILR